MTKHIVCFSGGHSSALVAIAVASKYGAENTILLNHDINENVESPDIKRFKLQVSNYIGVPITYANHKGLPLELLPDQFDVALHAQAFKVRGGFEVCTSRLKTEPFMTWLKTNVADKDCVIYYGFDRTEVSRIQRRTGILGAEGYKTDYPLAFWPSDSLLKSTKEIGIEPPNQYTKFKHANCIGCLKAGKQHWYIVYCERKDIFEKAKNAEEEIGYSIIWDATLEQMEPIYKAMQTAGIEPTEHMDPRTYWAKVRSVGIDTTVVEDIKPCECVL